MCGERRSGLPLDNTQSQHGIDQAKHQKNTVETPHQKTQRDTLFPLLT